MDELLQFCDEKR